MKRLLLVCLGLIFVGSAVGIGLFLWTDLFWTSVSIQVENRTSEVVQIGINDQSIGCGSSESVAPETTSQVSLELDGGVLCIGVTNPYSVSVSVSGEQWLCYWGELEADRRIVVTDDGPDCGTPVLGL
jgi:hypothetical protein